MEVLVLDWVQNLEPAHIPFSTMERSAFRFFSRWVNSPHFSWSQLIQFIGSTRVRMVVSEIADADWGTGEVCGFERLKTFVLEKEDSREDSSLKESSLQEDESPVFAYSKNKGSFSKAQRALQCWPMTLISERDSVLCIWTMLVCLLEQKFPRPPGLTDLHLNVIANALTWERRGMATLYFPKLWKWVFREITQEWPKRKMIFKVIDRWPLKTQMHAWAIQDADTVHPLLEASKISSSSSKVLDQLIQYSLQRWIRYPSLFVCHLFPVWIPSWIVSKIVPVIFSVEMLQKLYWSYPHQARWYYIRWIAALQACRSWIDLSAVTKIQFQRKYHELFQTLQMYIVLTDEWKDLFFQRTLKRLA